MFTSQEERKAAHDKLHATGKQPVRLKVIPGGADLRESINGTLTQFAAGEVFDHPAPERAKQLLAIHPPIVMVTTEPTKAEAALRKEEDEAAIDLVSAELREKAKKIVLARREKLAGIDKMLRGMKPDAFLAELEKRGMKGFNGDTDAAIQTILDNEKANLEKVA